MKVRKWSKCVSSILTLTSVLNGAGAPRPCCRMCLLAASKRCDVSPGMYHWIFFSETKSAMVASTCFLVLHPVAFWYVSANASRYLCSIGDCTPRALSTTWESWTSCQRLPASSGVITSRADVIAIPAFETWIFFARMLIFCHCFFGFPIDCDFPQALSNSFNFFLRLASLSCAVSFDPVLELPFSDMMMVGSSINVSFSIASTKESSHSLLFATWSFNNKK